MSQPTESWKVKMTHLDDCAECEDAAEAAINHAKESGSTTATSSFISGNRDAFGQDIPDHAATVERVS